MLMLLSRSVILLIYSRQVQVYHLTSILIRNQIGIKWCFIIIMITSLIIRGIECFPIFLFTDYNLYFLMQTDYVIYSFVSFLRSINTFSMAGTHETQLSCKNDVGSMALYGKFSFREVAN